MNYEYFHRVAKETSTRLWINNPTIKEAELAIGAGAISCTTNPSYSSKMIKSHLENDYVLEVIDSTIKEYKEDKEAAVIVQQRLAIPIFDKFLPLYEKNPATQGFVSLQSDPYRDEDTEYIINEALQYHKLWRNYIAKIPVTKAGLPAIDALIRKNIPVIATEVMAISQATAVCEIYKRASDESGQLPPLYLTHITGIFDEYLAGFVKNNNINISPEVLSKAGTIIAHKQYKIVKERKYKVIMLGGGARTLSHFTEMVGGDMHITINWSTAKELIDMDSPVFSCIEKTHSQSVIDELCEKLPDFRKAFIEEGLTVEEFKGFGPVDFFRNSFIGGWNHLLGTINERRKKIN